MKVVATSSIRLQVSTKTRVCRDDICVFFLLLPLAGSDMAFCSNCVT